MEYITPFSRGIVEVIFLLDPVNMLRLPWYKISLFFRPLCHATSCRNFRAQTPGNYSIWNFRRLITLDVDPHSPVNILHSMYPLVFPNNTGVFQELLIQSGNAFRLQSASIFLTLHDDPLTKFRSRSGWNEQPSWAKRQTFAASHGRPKHTSTPLSIFQPLNTRAISSAKLELSQNKTNVQNCNALSQALFWVVCFCTVYFIANFKTFQETLTFCPRSYYMYNPMTVGVLETPARGKVIFRTIAIIWAHKPIKVCFW